MGMLDGKVAIVTGAGNGLGRAHCHALAAEGATVVVSNRVRDDGARPSAEVVAQEITKAGGTAIADSCDVEDWNALGALVERTVSDLGRLDIVVNNAGILVWDAICDIDEATYDDLMAINVKGTFALTRHACAYWREAAGRGDAVTGRIINTTSGIGLFGFRFPWRPLRHLEGRHRLARQGDGDGDAPVRRHGQRDLARGAHAHGQGHLPRGARRARGLRPLPPREHLAAGRLPRLRRRRMGFRPGLLHPGRPHTARRRLVDRRRVPQRVRAQPQPAELANAIPLLHNALPPLQPGTSLQDAMQGIDPERQG